MLDDMITPKGLLEGPEENRDIGPVRVEKKGWGWHRCLECRCVYWGAGNCEVDGSELRAEKMDRDR
jgi:hypothetical protein